jgi:hypothetical protein
MPLKLRRRDLPPLSVARARAAAVPLPDGRVMVIGGNARRSTEPKTGICEVRCWSTGTVEIVDIARGDVMARSPLHAPREAAWAGHANGSVAVAGGLADHG